MNTIIFSNTLACFGGPDREKAERLLKYRRKGYQFTTLFKLGMWDGYDSLMDEDGIFPAGLVPWLVYELERLGVRLKVQDERPPALDPIVIPNLRDFPQKVELRPYQEEMVQAGLSNERGVFEGATGSGKTVVMCELIRRLGRRALVLVHRKDLLHQTAKAFTEQLGVKRGEVVGIIGDGVKRPRAITVATVQTLYRGVKEGNREMLEWLHGIGQVHVDEAHHIPAASYGEVMKTLANARFRYGWSATPHKSGDLETIFKLTAWLGPVVYTARAHELTEKGYLVPADVFMLKLPRQEMRFYQDYHDAVQYGIIENAGRNQVIVDLVKRLDETGSGPIVVLVERIEHGEALSHLLGAPFIAGDAPTKVRQKAWEGIRNGKTNVVIASKIADEGLDIPSLTYLVLAGAGKAPHLTLQRVGRGLRLSEGKDRLFVFDFADEGKWLGKQARTRLKTYKAQSSYTVMETELKEVLP